MYNCAYTLINDLGVYQMNKFLSLIAFFVIALPFIILFAAIAIDALVIGTISVLWFIWVPSILVTSIFAINTYFDL
jgi:hypothetical protein